MGLRLRIALLLAAVCAAGAVAVGVVGLRSTEQRLVDELDRSLEQVSGLFIAARNTDRVPARVLGDVYTARQLDGDGTVLRTSFVSSMPVSQTVIDDVFGSLRARHFGSGTADDGAQFRVLTIGLDVGALQIARPLDETENVLADLRRSTLLLVGVTALAGAAIGWFVAGRLAAPLRRLASAAETVEASGDLDVDLGPDAGNDEVGRLRRSFGSMLTALSRSRAEQRRLVQDAGHELRTPLTSLRTNLAVMRRHSDMPAEMRADIVADLDAEVDELADLVDELVAAASGEHDDEHASEIDVAQLARTVAERVGRRRGRTIDVVADAGPDGAGVAIAGPLGVARAMTNVIDNACKFDTSGGSITVEVDERTTPAGRVVAFRAIDGGPGVPDDELGAIFDRFHRVEATRTMPGSGLGLAIVRDVVARAGGSVVAVNRPSGGAEIGFDLPAAG